MNAIVPAALAVFLGVLLGGAFAAAGDGDLVWQRALGDFVLLHHALPATLGAATFTAPNARWLPHEWIFATLWALAERAGLEAVFRIGCALAAFAALAIDARRARRAGPLAVAIALMLVVTGLLPSFGVRAQVPAWPLIALVLLVLEARPSRAPWVVPIAVLWDNLHASGLIVPAIVIAHGFGRVLDERRWLPLRSTIALATATALASAVTPFGFHFAAFAVAWSLNPATDLITEWQPASPLTLRFCIGALLVALLLVAGELRGVRLSWSQRLLTLVLLGAGLLHVRSCPLFCIVAGPWAAAAVSALLPRRTPNAARLSLSDRGLVALGALGAIALAILAAQARHAGRDDESRAVAQVVASHRSARVACEDFSLCSRFAGAPAIRVFIDGRVDAYPDRVFAEYRRILAGQSAAVLDHWNVDTVLAQRGSAFARSLPSSRWRCERQGATQIFVRV